MQRSIWRMVGKQDLERYGKGRVDLSKPRKSIEECRLGEEPKREFVSARAVALVYIGLNGKNHALEWAPQSDRPTDVILYLLNRRSSKVVQCIESKQYNWHFRVSSTTSTALIN